VAAPEVVAAAAAMAAYSCRDAASTAVERSQKVAAVAWTVARATAKSDGATTMVSRSMGSGVVMVEVGSGLGADGPAPGAGRAGAEADGPSRVEQRAALYWCWCRWAEQRPIVVEPDDDLKRWIEGRNKPMQGRRGRSRRGCGRRRRIESECRASGESTQAGGGSM
jgi:hypothetical protein